jgi:hypothetical protein
MAEPHLDHPGDVTWFPGQRPAPVLGDCPHTRCPHDSLRCVAWGPDLEHYTLDQCTVPTDAGGCGGQCRAWSSEVPHPRGGVRYGWGPWRQVGPSSEVTNPATLTGIPGPNPADPPRPTRPAAPVPLPDVEGFPEIVRARALLNRPPLAHPNAYTAGVDATLAALFGELLDRGWVLAKPKDPGT